MTGKSACLSPRTMRWITSGKGTELASKGLTLAAAKAVGAEIASARWPALFSCPSVRGSVVAAVVARRARSVFAGILEGLERFAVGHALTEEAPDISGLRLAEATLCGVAAVRCRDCALCASSPSFAQATP